jgi:CBS-domain-containing membrane protein
MDAAELSQQVNALEALGMTVAEVMTRPVVTAQAEETLGAATARMVKGGLKRLPVVNSQGRLVGMLSRLDILRQVAKSSTELPAMDGRTGATRTVADVMSADIPMVNQSDDLATLVEKFAQTASHRLIVVDDAGKVLGLISDSDVVARVQPEVRGGILRAFQRLGKPPVGKEIAKNLMSPGVLTAAPELTTLEALKKMLAESRKWLVVVDEQGSPLGLVDRRIMLESMASFYRKD